MLPTAGLGGLPDPRDSRVSSSLLHLFKPKPTSQCKNGCLPFPGHVIFSESNLMGRRAQQWKLNCLICRQTIVPKEWKKPQFFSIPEAL